MQSSEQRVLPEIPSVVGGKPRTEFQLQFAQRRIIDTVNEVDNQKYKKANAYEEGSISRVSAKANIVLYHHSFRNNKEEDVKKLKLKCRNVQQENRDTEKSKVRFDSSTA